MLTEMAKVLRASIGHGPAPGRAPYLLSTILFPAGPATPEDSPAGPVLPDGPGPSGGGEQQVLSARRAETVGAIGEVAFGERSPRHVSGVREAGFAGQRQHLLAGRRS